MEPQVVATSEQVLSKSIQEIFGIDASRIAAEPEKARARVFEPTSDTPEVDPGYRFRVEQVRNLRVWLYSVAPPEIGMAKMKKNLLVYGPTGSGKTTLIKQLAARTGRALFRVQCNEELESEQMFGSFKLRQAQSRDGLPSTSTELTFTDGPILRWARTPNSILLLDEIDQLSPTSLMALNGIFDGDDILVHQTMERIRPAPGCLIAATGNTNGRGSTGQTGGSSTLYKGVKRQNIATLDRFFSMHVDYLSEEEEIENLVSQTKVDLVIAQAMAKLATSIRARFLGQHDPSSEDAEPLEITLTTRNLVNWALTFPVFMKNGLNNKEALLESLNFVLLNSASRPEADAIRDAWTAVIG